MRKYINCAGVAAALALLGCVVSGEALAGTTQFSTSSSFLSGLGAAVVDDYENPGYHFSQNDPAMSGVLSQTSYQTGTWINLNEVLGDASGHLYCSGCNGVFTLKFSSTSLSTPQGVFAVGFDYFNSPDFPFEALVKFGNGSIGFYGLNTYYDSFLHRWFFGLQSTLGIESITFGPHNGDPTKGYFDIDNLTIGSALPSPAPEPGIWALMVIGLGLTGAVARRNRRRTAVAA